MKEQADRANDFIDFIAKSPTKYHAINNIKSKLLKHNFIPLSFDNKWELSPSGKYFIEQDNSALIAFCMSPHDFKEQSLFEDGIRLVCAHTDSPTFKIKPVAQMITTPGHYMQLNTQGYAWPILSTWFDRPLSLAGRVALKSKSPFKPTIRLIDIQDPILLIPNIAFHLTKGKTESGISKQKEMLPIMGMANRETNENELFELMAKKLNIDKENILDYELYLYPVDKGQLVGINADFIVTPRQDDLIMVYAASEPFLRNTLTKIVKSIGGDEENLIRLISRSFAVSLDSSFAMHPNYMECSDPTCTPIMNKGVVIKYDANMHYATTAFSSAVFQEICHKNNIPYQKAAANSDLRTGGTISAFMQTQVEMNCVEVGIPTWAVHSAYESCGTKDFYNLIRSLISFWNQIKE